MLRLHQMQCRPASSFVQEQPQSRQVSRSSAASSFGVECACASVEVAVRWR